MVPASFEASCLLSRPRAISVNATAVASTARPNGVQLKKLSCVRPCSRNMPSIIMLGDDAIRVIIPLTSAATDNGISIRLLFMPVFLATARTTGINMATIAEELINAPIPPASVMMSTIKRVSLPPPNFITASPRRCATPVFTSASPTTKIAAIRITTGSPNPASASCGVSTRLSMSASTTTIATISARGRPQAKSTMAPASMPKTISIGPVMAARPSPKRRVPPPGSACRDCKLARPAQRRASYLTRLRWNCCQTRIGR